MIKNLNLLIKPSSASCNLACTYCFYRSSSKRRSKKDQELMDDETLELLITRAFESRAETISFLFQGGEPLLMGLNFFEKFHDLLAKKDRGIKQVDFAIQTNGLLLDEDSVRFFRDHGYLVGISLDGIRETHDRSRVFEDKSPSFDRVLEKILLLKKYHVNFNVLTVVSEDIVVHIEEIYELYKSLDLRNLQFIPRIRNQETDYLSPLAYGVFLDKVFKLWYEDLKDGRLVGERFFENILLRLLGRPVESCQMLGHCTINPVIEADGSVYACDFFVKDSLKLGHIKTRSLDDLLLSKKAYDFVRPSFSLSLSCRKCPYLDLCRGWCFAYRKDKSIYCESFKYFYSRNLGKLIEIRDYIIDKNV
ncbi:MAG: SPASM domain-containing protein [Anaerococcus sp.]|nr:SPASM domain-containing protein [Anaerococcus sp.]